jgi:hypothetical protein
VASAIAAPAAAQTRQEEPDAMDVAQTPFRDLNISSEDIDPILLKALADVYATEGTQSCDAIHMKIAELDNALGDDFDLPRGDDGGLSVGRVAQSVVGSLLPFRGILREVTGANEKRREQELAAAAGLVRRGFLKGVGLAQGCDYPARPREIVAVAAEDQSMDDQVNRTGD